MEQYQSGETCRMEFLQQCLDDDSAAACGRCDVCVGPWFSDTIPQDAMEVAGRSLGSIGVAVEPRTQWPTGMPRLGVDVKGRIEEPERVQPGRVVARLSDLGWGSRLRAVVGSQADDEAVPEDLVRACVTVLAQWPWHDRPVAVVAMPSRSRPVLVASLAEQISRIGRLPLLGALQMTGGGPVGQAGGNSAFRLAGVWGRVDVGVDLATALHGVAGPVLLVDDRIESRWTMTVAGAALRRAGAPAVLPFALALAS
jgi:ATP-dependent DNA helicase RecQ